MFAAYPHLEVRPCGTPLVDPDPDQLPHALLIQGDKRVHLKDPLLNVERQELPGVIPAESPCRLREVIRPKGEELCLLCDLICNHGGPGKFYHRPDLILDLNLIRLHDP